MNEEFIRDCSVTVERCIDRCRETVARPVEAYPSEFDRADIMTVNLIRLAETLIDMAKHMVKSEGLGLAKDSRTAFRLLVSPLNITFEEAESLSNMVGFRNLAVHNYAVIEDHIVELIVRNELDLPMRVADAIKARASGEE